MPAKSIIKYLVMVLDRISFSLSFLLLGVLFYLYTLDMKFGFDYIETLVGSLFFVGIGSAFLYHAVEDILDTTYIASLFDDFYSFDIQIYEVLKRNRNILLAFLIPIIFSIAILIFEYKTGFFEAFINSHGINNKYWYYYLLILMVFSIYGIAYILMGELLQSTYGKRKRPFLIDIIIDYILLYPFLILMSAFGLIIILTRNRKASSIVYNFLLRIKYITYFTMSAIAYEDIRFFVALEKSEINNSANSYILEYIEENKGMPVLTMIPATITFFLYNVQFNFIGKNNMIYILVAIWSVYIIYSLLCEQVIIYQDYLKKKGIEI